MAVANDELSAILTDCKVMGCGSDFEVEWWSPADEDVIISLHGESLRELADSAKEAYDDFDPDDHAAIIYHAKHYGSADQQRFYARAPSELTDLVEDAEEINSFYKDVWERLEAAAAATP
jgi:hypothetical protein